MFRTILAALVLLTGLSGTVWACPDYSLSGERYDATGRQLYSEKSFFVRAGGNNNIQYCSNVRPRTDRGRGYVTTAPDFTFYLTGMERYKLVISVVSNCDSVLLINTGSANWYYDDDDNGNLDARISLTRPSNGWMDIWVGTHDGAVCDANLRMETFDR